MVRMVVDLPEDLHRQLDEQARLRGVSVSDYVREMLAQRAGSTVRDELFDDSLQFDHAPSDVAANVDRYLDDPT